MKSLKNICLDFLKRRCNQEINKKNNWLNYGMICIPFKLYHNLSMVDSHICFCHLVKNDCFYCDFLYWLQQLCTKIYKYKDDEKVCYYLNDFFKKINEYKYIFISPNFQNMEEVSEKINLKSFDFYFNERYSCLEEMKMVKLISFDYYFDKWNACLCNHSSFGVI